jgi:hypothetical protein
MEKKSYFRADYQYATAQGTLTQMYDGRNTGSEPLMQGTMRVLSLRAGVRFNGFDISLFAQNALDYNTPTYWYRDSQLTTDTNIMLRGYQPRTIGATATYRY